MIDNEMLDAPAGVPTNSEPVRQDWPESTEVRHLQIVLADKAIADLCGNLIDNLRRLDSLAAAKKADADEYKSRIEGVQKEVDAAADVIKSGKDSAEVTCRWRYECQYVDGLPVYHSELKTLVREDTYEPIETKPISPSDRQMVLPIEIESGPTTEEMTAALHAAGWAISEADPEEACGFLAVSVNGYAARPIDADSMADAVAILFRDRESAATKS